MKNIITAIIISFSCTALATPNIAIAHSGGTNQYGCHSGSQSYHCHGSSGGGGGGGISDEDKDKAKKILLWTLGIGTGLYLISKANEANRYGMSPIEDVEPSNWQFSPSKDAAVIRYSIPFN